MREVVDVLPQASVAVNVLVCVRVQPVVPTEPVVKVTLTIPQLSVAVALPNAASMEAGNGLQPNESDDPLEVIDGFMLSLIV